jgi:6-phosphogluconolactonase
MRVEVLPDSADVARRAAEIIAEDARAAVTARGRFLLAVSGGRTPCSMLRALAGQDIPWGAVHLFQVDERVAPAGDPDRNLTHLYENLLGRVALPPANLHMMPVEQNELDAAAAGYAAKLAEVAGSRALLDVVQLGLGLDGHTASLVPGDPVLDVTDRDVATTGVYSGRRRMTFTYRVLDRARRILWVVTGAAKTSALARLAAGDRSIPAGRVRSIDAVVLADVAAAGPVLGE